MCPKECKAAFTGRELANLESKLQLQKSKSVALRRWDATPASSVYHVRSAAAADIALTLSSIMCERRIVRMDVFRASDLRGVRVEEDRGEVGKRYCRPDAPASFVTAVSRPANVTRVTHHVQLHNRYSARHDASGSRTSRPSQPNLRRADTQRQTSIVRTSHPWLPS